MKKVKTTLYIDTAQDVTMPFYFFALAQFTIC